MEKKDFKALVAALPQAMLKAINGGGDPNKNSVRTVDADEDAR